MKFSMVGDREIIDDLNAKIPEKALKNNLPKMAAKIEGIAKKATVWKTGRLRSSIFHEVSTFESFVGTNVKYAPFIEFGTKYTNMKGRHMEGGRKVIGIGMFAYTIEQIKNEDLQGDIYKDIEKEWG